MNFERVILIKNKTRLEKLIERFNSKSQARFYIEHSGGDFDGYEHEHNTFYNSLLSVQRAVTKQLKTTVLEKEFLPSYIFTNTDLVVVLGQDGLVANTAKYVGSNPILAINPDPGRNSGVLLPFNIGNYQEGLIQSLNGSFRMKRVTLAEAELNDGQKLLAFNDFFIGKANHTSARYKISFGEQTEIQSSSGLIVSTGAGSTGWLSSIFNEYNGLSQFFGTSTSTYSYEMQWDEDRLCFIVREPYNSPSTSSKLVVGAINNQTKLTIESQMPENGVIFSDGILEDYLEFNSGRKVCIGTASEKACLISR
ncbi:sugar kinase [Fulvivirga sp. 29W222]|uniref:Sugar kinase n=1 Tax=Fulvivirga marina TaxID=2494733 RepID=A0A937FYZ4_9BACT|nr:sugar kinase [Fulvivirga marina]MBL6446955.1 sugar kinase [Fulvivirga marina]